MEQTTISDSRSFLDELLNEAEEKERKLEAAQADLVLIEIRNLENEIFRNFETAEQEKQIIDEWALKRNSKLNDRKVFLEQKLEIFLTEQGLKSLDLANGKLQKRLTPQRLEITDLDLFLKHATNDMISVQPESVKPDLNKIKAFWKRSRRVPQGTRLIEGTEKFSIKLKQNGETHG